MRRLLFLLLVSFTALRAAPEAAKKNVVESPPRPTPLDGAVLGLVEGVTEFLPISSTGHLIVANKVLGFDSTAPVTVPGRSRTVEFKQAADAFIVIIQIGAIAAVALLYWGRVTRILAGLIGRDPAGLRLAINIVIACIPAGILGLTLGDLIDEYLFSTTAVAVSLVAGAILMFRVEAKRRARTNSASLTSPPLGTRPLADATLETLRPAQALLIGGMQCLALWPGTSRSMVTIVGGYIAGLPPVLAAEFSFLVGLPLLSAAALLKTYKHGPEVLAAFGSAPIAIGLVVAAVSAAVAVRFLVGFLTRHGLAAFAWYRIALAAALLGFTLLA